VRRFLMWNVTDEGITRGAAYSVIFLFVLGLLFSILGYWYSTTAVNRAIANTATLQQVCITSNDFRSREAHLWTFVLQISSQNPPPHETPAEKQQREAELKLFRAYLDRTFRLRNCNQPPYTP
jgi:hypothetical protein